MTTHLIIDFDLKNGITNWYVFYTLQISPPNMLKHYFKISWRNIQRNKFYTLILVAGLSVGIASSLLLGIYTWHELTYDNFHEKKERIFLVGVREKDGENEGEGGWTTPPTGPALKEFFPEIEASVRLCTWFEDVLVSRGDIRHSENNIVGADSSIFQVFTIPFVAGDPKTALREPNSIVITEKTAKKYFGDENALGQTLYFDHFFNECRITGIVEDLPSNSHFEMDMLLSLSSLKKINFDFNHWQNHTFVTYVLVDEKSTAQDIEQRLGEFVQKNLDTYLIQRYKKSFAEMYKQGDYYSLFLMPLKDVHLSTMLYENREGKRTLTYALGIIGIIILVLVAINYTNLATVLTLSRSKEAGIRKVSGSKSKSLFNQFLIESIVTVFLGLFIALGLVEMILPFFNSLTQQQLTIDYLNGWVILGLVGFAMILGLISGFYPAMTFSSFNPIQSLKGSPGLKSKNAWLRNTLVIFQFTICITMIVSTLVVFKQLRFMTEKNLGFNKDQVLIIKKAGGLAKNKTSFKNELLKHPGISSVSYSETTPGREFNGHGQHFAGTPEGEFHTIFPLVADEDILQTLDIKIVAGQGFKNQLQKNDKAILNEAAVKTLNLDRPLEQTIDVGTLGKKPVDLIGVAKDFHFKSFHFSIEPLVIYHLDVDNDPQHRATFTLVKIVGSELPSTIQYIQETWKKYAHSYPFEYSFLDQDFDRLFERENITMKVYGIFSVISISIACLGLLGMASFFVSKRTKEIGIRKIAGATFLNIAGMLSRDFTSWIFVSIMLGSTLSWYLMEKWLNNFAYQTSLDWWIFLTAGFGVVLIAAVTVSWHIYEAANRNPVETLRHE